MCMLLHILFKKYYSHHSIIMSITILELIQLFKQFLEKTRIFNIQLLEKTQFFDNFKKKHTTFQHNWNSN